MLKTAGEAGKAGEAGDVKTGWVRLSTSVHFRRGGRASLPWATMLAARAGKLTVARGPPPSTFAQLRHTAVVSPLAVKSR